MQLGLFQSFQVGSNREVHHDRVHVVQDGANSQQDEGAAAAAMYRPNGQMENVRLNPVSHYMEQMILPMPASRLHADMQVTSRVIAMMYTYYIVHTTCGPATIAYIESGLQAAA